MTEESESTSIKSLSEIIWSPAFRIVHITEEIAPIPDDVATAASPDSNWAILSSKTVVVGFPSLEYIYPGSSSANLFPPCSAESNTK